MNISCEISDLVSSIFQYYFIFHFIPCLFLKNCFHDRYHRFIVLVFYFTAKCEWWLWGETVKFHPIIHHVNLSIRNLLFCTLFPLLHYIFRFENFCYHSFYCVLALVSVLGLNIKKGSCSPPPINLYSHSFFFFQFF